MKPTRKLNRRSFFAAVAGTVVATGAIGLVATDEAEALQGSDSDRGPNSDPPGRGRGSSCSDSDSGRYGDPGGRGRRCGGGRRRTGITDRDTGSGSDAAGYGTGRRARRSGCTDSDRGRNSDPAGNGRCRPRRRSCTDSDTGRNSDPAGRGRRC